ncbi:Hypothetical predicted protein, partial [Paramuricea clavata]
MWSNWTACNVSCGTGYQSRNRTWYNVVNDERSCNGTDTQVKQCIMTSCPTPTPTFSTPPATNSSATNRSATNPPATATPTTVPTTVFSNWLNWTECNVTCGAGNQTRRCSNDTGYGCNGKASETKECNLGPCPVDGYFSEWSLWSQCTQTCGSGVISRDRTCKEPIHGGKNCSGLTLEENVCTNPTLCPGETGFTPWGEWGDCSVECLKGIRTRTRHCPAGVDNTTCTGALVGNKTCFAGPCPVNGNWSGWSGWPTGCPGVCGSSFNKRTRKCDSPVPLHGGANCTGPVEQVKECNHSSPCDGESGFTDWSAWIPCSATCGEGVNRRTRECRPESSAENCVNATFQEKPCYFKPCPVNGGWSVWQDWSRCRSSCGSGVRVRKRTCSDPKQSDGGLPCYGNNAEEKVCVMPEDCKDDYAYHNWESWSECDTTCGFGKKIRRRQCKLIPEYPPRGDPPCESPTKDDEHISCFIQPCSIDGNFTGWSFWSLCSVTCGEGVRKRTRNCTHPPPMYGGADCTGKRLDVRDCNMNTSCLEDGGWSEWTPWSSCDLTQCGHQMEQRKRLCDNPAPQAAGNYCLGKNEEEIECSEGKPPVCEKDIPKAGWTDWSWWKACSKSCDGGVRSRHRKCSNPPLTPGGLNCTGSSTEAEVCNTHHCPVDGNFTEWSPWTNCTLSCRDSELLKNGTRERNRSCTNPKPQHGGLDCGGENFTRESCNEHMCPIDGRLTPWSKYSFCSKPCNHGKAVRTRSCTNPLPIWNESAITCVISVSYNFSDGDQLPILRDVLDNPPGSNVSLLWMNSSV